jgi:hypothetical protein
MATVAWVFTLKPTSPFLSLLLADEVRARQKESFLQWLREAKAANAMALSLHAHAAVDQMAEGLAQGTPGEPASNESAVRSVEPRMPADPRPDALADAVACDERVRVAGIPDARAYGDAPGDDDSFSDQGRRGARSALLWRRKDGAWRIVVYDVELP